jgi:hypothetical protein
VLEFATQLATDVLRGMGYGARWLIICRVYFITFGK